MVEKAIPQVLQKRHWLFSNHEPKEMTYILRKRRNRAWFHYNNRTILISDGQFASLPSSELVIVEPQLNIRHDDIQDPRTMRN